MRRTSYRPYFLFALIFLCAMSLPQQSVEKLRFMATSSLSPSWHALRGLKNKALYVLTFPVQEKRLSLENEEKFEQLLQENRLLKEQMKNVQQWVRSEERIQEQWNRLKSLRTPEGDFETKEFLKRRAQELSATLELKTFSLPARVVFREPAAWSSTVWIDLGEIHNERLNKVVIGVNSPVLAGDSIVGVVESVGKQRSRVRLITDRRVSPSVRAVRGKEQNRFLLEHLHALLTAFELRKDLAPLTSSLEQIKALLVEENTQVYLAKGELHGMGHPLWRSRGQQLKGVGFNCDFADEEGPARDLRTGKPYGPSPEKLPLLLPGDLLVTTGLDGVFPAGFSVAIVKSIETLKEGATSYALEAVATAGDLENLEHVTVLPPVNHL